MFRDLPVNLNSLALHLCSPDKKYRDADVHKNKMAEKRSLF